MGVTLFLPVLDEAGILVANTETLLRYARTLGMPFEILIGSNGSTDETETLGRALALKHPEIQFFHRPDKGPGAAFRDAIARMRHDRLVALDMDLPIPLSFIPSALALLETHEAVIGSKKLGVENRHFYRRWGSDLFIACSRRLLGLPFDDYSLGAKAYRKPFLERYRGAIGQGTFYVQRMIYLAHEDGAPMVQIPVDCADNRRSRFNLPLEGMYRFGHLFGLALRRLQPRRRTWPQR